MGCADMKEPIRDHLTHTTLPGGGDIFKTRRGQAHFALASTSDKCGACVHFMMRKGARNHRLHCELAAHMAGVWQAAITHDCIACKYFRVRSGSPRVSEFAPVERQEVEGSEQ